MEEGGRWGDLVLPFPFHLLFVHLEINDLQQVVPLPGSCLTETQPSDHVLNHEPSSLATLSSSGNQGIWLQQHKK